MTSVKDIPESIQWHEGMLLHPQHFQQLNYRAEDIAYYYAGLFVPYLWGIIQMDIDELKLSQGIFSITELEAVMPDGLPVYHNEALYQRHLEINIQETFTSGVNQITLHLAVPAYQFNSQRDRFYSEEREVVDDAERQKKMNIPVLRPKLSLLTDAQINKSYASFPIAKILFREASYQLGSFIPPILSLNHKSTLFNRCEQIILNIRKKTQKLDDELSALTSNFNAQDYLGVQYKIERLVSELPRIEAMLNAKATHPFLVYLALCSLAGKVCSLNYNKVPPVFSAYDHNRLEEVFSELENYINLSISQIIEKYQLVILTIQQGRFTVPQKHLPTNKEPLVIGIYTTHLHRQDLEHWLKTVVIATEDHIDRAISNRVYGASRQTIDYYEPLNIIPTANLVLIAINTSDEFISANKPLIIESTLEEDYLPAPKEIGVYVSKQKEVS